MSKIVNGVTYHDETPDSVIRVLENARASKRRVRVRYGFTEHAPEVKEDPSKLGRDWLDEHGCEGTIGSSMGPKRVPLLIHNSRSMGGGAILDHCIVRIIDSRTKTVLYTHLAYHNAKFEILERDHFIAEAEAMKSGYKFAPLYFAVLANGEVHAQFESFEKARRWARRMSV